MRKKYTVTATARYKKVSMKLVSRDSVLVKRSGKGRMKMLLDGIRNALKDAPDQMALELANETRATHATLRKHLVREGYNLAYNSDKMTIWVWRGL